MNSQRTFITAGIDEAGRGALAGPVVAGACILTHELFRRRHSLPRWSPFKKIPAIDCLIADSKQLSPEEREISYEWIIAHCAWGVGICEADVIESEGILAANQEAMHRAIADLERKTRPEFLLVDGRDKFSFPYPHRSIIRGDATELCIAAASIIAKVTRDRIMRDHDRTFPLYGFAQHKGYGTKEHLETVRQNGPCPLHRRSFLSRILQKLQAPV